MNYRSKSFSIQALRGSAATLVVCLHICTVSSFGKNQWGAAAYNFFLHFGAFGVDIFFVVSGVIIAGLLQQNQAGRPLYALQFFVRRFVRIYPIYWLSLGATIAVLLSSGGLYPVDFSQLTPKTLSLLTTNFLHPISWTLVCEIQFYLVAGLAMLFGRRAGVAIAIWGLAHIGAVIAAERGWDHGLYFATPITLEFLPGLLIGYIAPRRSLPLPRACIVLGCIIAAVASVYAGSVLGTTTGWLRLAVYGTAASLIVWGALSVETAGWQPASWLTFLGDISYSTYMWHWPTMIAVSLLFGAWLSQTVGVAAYIFTTGICVLAVSWASYRWIERPSMRWVNRLFDRPVKSQTTAAIPPGASGPLPTPALRDGLAVRQT